uniref:Homeobox domain-containing protein n=1 Tax=Macrostomum lignano TaxID=282301 RepID=A0A1I8FDQ7_9PLAT
ETNLLLTVQEIQQKLKEQFRAGYQISTISRALEKRLKIVGREMLNPSEQMRKNGLNAIIRPLLWLLLLLLFAGASGAPATAEFDCGSVRQGDIIKHLQLKVEGKQSWAASALLSNEQGSDPCLLLQLPTAASGLIRARLHLRLLWRACGTIDSSMKEYQLPVQLYKIFSAEATLASIRGLPLAPDRQRDAVEVNSANASLACGFGSAACHRGARHLAGPFNSKQYIGHAADMFMNELWRRSARRL